MAYTPGDKYVTPIGISLFNNLFGESQGGGPSNFFGDGGMFGANPFAAPQQAWARQMFGMGVADPTDQLLGAIGDSTSRYENWSPRWDQWFNTDVQAMDENGNPTGRTLFSPYHQTGLRVGQDYGVERDPNTGNVVTPGESQMFRYAKGVRNNLNEDPWLDPTTGVSGMRLINSNMPYGRPDPSNYAATMEAATGGPGGGDGYLRRGVGGIRRLNEATDFDQYGQRGVDQTNALAGANIADLTSGIDTEAQRSLAFKLPEIQQAFEAAGLGRSGAGQLQMQQAMGDVLGQANRDKQRVMADYTDREANRQAQAINLATQQGFQGQGQEYGALAQALRDQAQGGAASYENYAGRQGQAALAGLGDLFAMNQGNRQSEQGLLSQMINNRMVKNQGDQNALFDMLKASGQYGLGSLDAERMGQSQALNDYMGLFNQREQMRANSLDEMLNLSERQRSIEQERINQQMQAGFLPLDLITRLTTGISGSNYQGASTSPWWAGALQGATKGAGESLGNAAGSWLQAQFGNA